MINAAVGFRVHSGWSALVAVCLEKGRPVVLHRQRLHLVETFSYRYRQPYHTAERMGLPGGHEFIAKSQVTARELAYRALQELQSELDARSYQLNRCALLLSAGRPLPELERILASHALIHTADGEFFREALLHASARCGLTALRIRDRELLERAAQTLRVTAAKLLAHVKELGRPFGSPWSQDEKFAALAAWLALKERASAKQARQPSTPA